MELLFDTERRAQQRTRDDQAAEYIERYLARGPTFVGLDEKLMLVTPEFRAAHRVLDAGCGVGYFALKIAPHVERVDAVDFSLESLRLLRTRAVEAHINNVHTQFADLTQPLPFSEATFDRVVSFQVLSYVPRESLGYTLSEFRRVLKPGGRVVFSVLKVGFRGDFADRDHDEVAGFRRNGYTASDLRAQLEAVGFSRYKIRGFFNTPARLCRWSDRQEWARPLVIAMDQALSHLPFSHLWSRLLLVEVVR